MARALVLSGCPYPMPPGDEVGVPEIGVPDKVPFVGDEKKPRREGRGSGSKWVSLPSLPSEWVSLPYLVYGPL